MAKRKLLYLSFEEGADMATVLRLKDLLRFAVGDGIRVRGVQGDRNGVSLENGEATVYYTAPHLFYRELGVLCEHARRSDRFEVFEDSFFETLSVMIDASRNGVPTVDTVCRMIDALAVMGYNMVMLYTEDVFTLTDHPYFGYMRGRYTPDQLRAVDDYAYGFGIEVIPCVECYGHMERYLTWPEASPIKDTSSVLLAREEKTFAFLDRLIGEISACFRSRRIHIGMDEADDMGRGVFMNRHGYVPAPQIFAEYMERLIGITQKHGLQPMMWSDMYYRSSGTSYGSNPDKCMLPDEVIKGIPEGVELVYWNYGERRRFADDYMLRSHKATGRKVIYAGGLWSWCGHFPENHYAMETIEYALNACRNHDVREVILTIWTNDNAECDWFANLLGLSYFAECCYHTTVDKSLLRSRFEACTGGDFDAFLAMSDYHNSFEDPTRYDACFRERFLGKALFWQDILEGLYDTHVQERALSEHYAAAAQRMSAWVQERPEDPWRYLYEHARCVFAYLADKTRIAERLHTAYQHGDRACLAEIADLLLPALKEKTKAVHREHKAIWLAHNSTFGWSHMDVRYAGVAARCDTAIELIHAYLSGERAEIESLAEIRLRREPSGFWQYSDLATPNQKT